MHTFLQNNQPFGVLYTNKNVLPVVLTGEQSVHLTPELAVTAHSVQHRADFTDTFAFTITGPRQRRLFFCRKCLYIYMLCVLLPMSCGTHSHELVEHLYILAEDVYLFVCLSASCLLRVHLLQRILIAGRASHHSIHCLPCSPREICFYWTLLSTTTTRCQARVLGETCRPFLTHEWRTRYRRCERR